MENTNEKKMYEVAEIQLTYKSNVRPSLRPQVNGSKEAYELLKENWDASRIEFVEQFKAVFLEQSQTRFLESWRYQQEESLEP